MHDRVLTQDRPDPIQEGQGWAEPLALAALDPPPPREAPVLPGRWTVFREQVRAVGESLRREAVGLGVVLIAVSATILSQLSRGSGFATFDLGPAALLPVALLGLFAPLAVWKSEAPGRRGYHRAMPVDSGEHAVWRSAAGWIWTLAAGAAYGAWLLLIMGLSGGSVSDAPLHRWVAPVVGGFVLYLLMSAVALVSRHPWRWLAGSALCYLLVNVMSDAVLGVRPLADLFQAIWRGRFGLLTVLTGGASGFPWDLIPQFGRWVAASAGWLAGSAAAFLVATRRQPDE